MIELIPAGQDAKDAKVGDFILVHRDKLVNRLIQFGQTLRYKGIEKHFAYWSHAALFIAPDMLQEAEWAGMARTPIAAYRHVDYFHVRMDCQSLDQAQIMAFANATQHDRYAYTTICCIALGLVTGGKVTFGYQGQMICSGFVARALERRGYFFAAPEDVMPADLAKLVGVPDRYQR